MLSVVFYPSTDSIPLVDDLAFTHMSIKRADTTQTQQACVRVYEHALGAFILTYLPLVFASNPVTPIS